MAGSVVRFRPCAMLPFAHVRDFHTRECWPATHRVHAPLYIGTRMSGPSCGGTAASLQRQYFTTNVLSSSSFPANRARVLLRLRERNNDPFDSPSSSLRVRAADFEDADGIIARINGRLHCSIRSINRRGIIDYLPEILSKNPVEIGKSNDRGFPFFRREGGLHREWKQIYASLNGRAAGLGRAFVPL